MSRAERLLQLLEILRRKRGVVTASELATATRVSVRTLYRDIEALRVQGVTIEGEAGTLPGEIRRVATATPLSER